MVTADKLIRLYRNYEALAIYDAYFEAKSQTRGITNEADGAADRMLMWVPLVFHCTTVERLVSIAQDGQVNPSKERGFVSFTELQIDELDRFHNWARKGEVAVAFPRVVLEPMGLFQPCYLRHVDEKTRQAFKCILPQVPQGYIEIDDDLGSLREVRVIGAVPFSQAVWILSDRSDDKRFARDPRVREICERHNISWSFWHPSHQQGVIRESVFRRVERDLNGSILKIQCCGKYYFPHKDSISEPKPALEMAYMTRPRGGDVKIRFPTFKSTDGLLQDGWEGPLTKFDMAKFFFGLLRDRFPEQLVNLMPRLRFVQKSTQGIAEANTENA